MATASGEPGGTFVTDRGRSGRFACDVVIVGGCGHVGLPLAVAFADRGSRVAIYDISEEAIESVNAGRLPFREPAAELPLRRAVSAGRLVASADPAIVGAAEHVIVVITGPASDQGEQVPDLRPDSVAAALADCAGHFRDGQILLLRSTVAPGTTASLDRKS